MGSKWFALLLKIYSQVEFFFFLIISNRCVLLKVWNLQKDKTNKIEVHNPTKRATLNICHIYYEKCSYICVYQSYICVYQSC